jgi:acyl-CoA synthetase (AMP-forming)/AMP-acid ligase II
MYGSTEVSLFAMSSPMTSGYRAGRSVPVGRAQDNVRLHILDEHLSPVPAGTVGELYIAGERLARGYHGHRGRTAARFIADPFGRAGDQVKIRGFRVAVAEVETALASYPGVTHAVVLANDAKDGDKRRALPEPDIESAVSYRAPESARHEALCAMFAEVLGALRVGIDDSLFDLSGQSPMAGSWRKAASDNTCGSGHPDSGRQRRYGCLRRGGQR